MGKQKLESQLEAHFSDLSVLDDGEESDLLPPERAGNGRTIRGNRPPALLDEFGAEGESEARAVVGDRPFEFVWDEPTVEEDDGGLSLLEQHHLLENLERRALQLETAAQVSRAITSTLDLDQLLVAAVELIRQRFDLYYVGVFLTDPDGEWAVLRAGTGDAGREMLARNHRLAVSGPSMIGWSIEHGQARIALETSEEAIRFNNPLLPETRSEMSLPLISRARVIGAMTIQSAEPAAFTVDDTVTLQTMADQLANAITNARLHEETERRLADLTVLSEISKALAGGMNEPDEIAHLIARQFLDVFQVDAAAVLQWDTQTDSLRTLADLKAEQADVLVREEHIDTVYPLADYPATAAALKALEPLVVQADDPRSDPAEREFMRSVGAATLLIVPLAIKQQPIGTIEIETHRVRRHFTDQEIELASILANQAAVTLENARLFGETLNRAEEMEALNAISSAAGRSLNLSEILAETLDALRRLTGFGAAIAAVADRKSGRLELAVQLDIPGSLHRQMVDGGLDGTLPKSLIDRGEITVVEDLPARGPAEHQVLSRSGFRSVIGIPLEHRGQSLGVVCLFDRATHRRRDLPLDLLAAAGNQISIAIANAQLLDQANDRTQELTTLNAVAGAVSGSLDLPQMLDSTLEIIMAFTGLEVGLYSIQNPHTDRLELSSHRNLPAAIETRLRDRGMRGTLCESVFEKGETIALDNIATASPVNVSALIARGLRSYVGVPLRHRGRILGTLCLFSYEEQLPAQLDVPLLEAATRQVAVGIANAQLFQETQHALAEAEHAYRRYLSREWEGFLTGTPRARGYVDTPAGLQNGDGFWSPDMEQAVLGGDVVMRSADGSGDEHGPASLAVPIQLRGQTIGVLNFYHEGEAWAWTSDDEALVRALSDHVALALENARLLEKTERRAHRERLASQLAAKIHGAGDTKTILATAAEGLGKALGVSRTVVRLADPGGGSPAEEQEEEEDPNESVG